MSLYLSERRKDRRRRATKPRPPQATDAVVVSVLDAAGHVGLLAPHLPSDWTVRAISHPRAAGPRDLLVLGNATGASVALVRRLHPYVGVIAVIDQSAPVEVIVDVLGAGAEACVRAGSTAILAGHLRACHRRRESGAGPSLPALAVN